MADLLTVPQIITIGKITQFLMANDNAAGVLFGKRLNKDTSPVMISYVTSSLSWQYETQPTDNTLRGTANYLLWLCGYYGVQARSASGGGSVTPITPAGTLQSPIEFYVASDTLIVTGASTVTLDGSSGNPDLRGYNMGFNRNNIPQAMVTDGASSYFLWNKTTGLMTVYGAAAAGELFSLNPYL